MNNNDDGVYEEHDVDEDDLEEDSKSEHGDEEDNSRGENENYLDNSDVESLHEDVSEDGIVELRRTPVRFPRYTENSVAISFSIGLSFTDHQQFKKALLKYAVQEKKDYEFIKNASSRVRVKCIDEHCKSMVYAANELHDGKEYFLVKILHEKHTCLKMFKISHIKAPWIAEEFEAMIYAHPGLDGCFLKGVVKEHLKADIMTPDGKEWAFMSDKKKGLLNVVSSIFPQAEHRLCARHIYANWYSNFCGEKLKVAFYSVAKCANEAQMKQWLDEIDNIKDGAKRSLENKYINQWCRAFFNPSSKCDSVDKNSTEAWNFVLIGARRFQVYFGRTQHCVHTQDKTCSCGAWELSGIPCCHAIAAIKIRAKDPYDYVDCYSKEKYLAAYGHPIEVVGSEKIWLHSRGGELLPPLPKAMPSRPKKARRRKCEPKKSKTKLSRHRRDMHCGNCKSSTHTNRTCTMRIEQYFLMTDYSLWEVILNGDSPPPTRIVDGDVQIVAPTNAE
nr:elongation factor G, III-V domain-containing protein [Tanacetum cinerariifolium]